MYVTNRFFSSITSTTRKISMSSEQDPGRRTTTPNHTNWQNEQWEEIQCQVQLCPQSDWQVSTETPANHWAEDQEMRRLFKYHLLHKWSITQSFALFFLWEHFQPHTEPLAAHTWTWYLSERDQRTTEWPLLKQCIQAQIWPLAEPDILLSSFKPCASLILLGSFRHSAGFQTDSFRGFISQVRDDARQSEGHGLCTFFINRGGWSSCRPADTVRSPCGADCSVCLACQDNVKY